MFRIWKTTNLTNTHRCTQFRVQIMAAFSIINPNFVNYLFFMRFCRMVHVTSGACAEYDEQWLRNITEQTLSLQGTGELQCGRCSWGWQLDDNYCYLRCWQWAAVPLFSTILMPLLQGPDMMLKVWNLPFRERDTFCTLNHDHVVFCLW